jgi:hypothetical protein
MNMRTKDQEGDAEESRGLYAVVNVVYELYAVGKVVYRYVVGVSWQGISLGRRLKGTVRLMLLPNVP